jgi:hypothetical protein
MMTPEKYKTLNLNKSSQFEVMINEDILGEIHSTDYYIRISKAFKFILEETHKPLGQWKQNPKCDDEMFGVVIDCKWHRLNTPETNKSGQFFLFKQCNIFLESHRKKGIKLITLLGREISTEKILIRDDWRTDPNLEKKIKDLLTIIRYNANEWLVPNNPICDELMQICYECMLVGDTAEFLCEMYLHKLHNDIKSYIFTEGLGDCKDIKQGIDCWVYDSNDDETTDQIKHKFYSKTEDSIKTNANFSLKSKCKYFVLVYKDKIVKIKNDKKTNVKNGSNWTFPLENCEIINIMYMFEELKSLMRITGNNGITMKVIKEDNDNYVKYIPEEKIVIINFPNDSDELFKDKILDLSNELEELFK